MDILTTRIATLSQKPEFSSDEYKKWVEQDDFIQFLQALPSLDEMLLYASASYVFLYSVLVPTRLVTPPDTDDLDQWSCNPFSCWGITVTGGNRSRVFLSPPLDHTGSKTLDRGEQIIFARRFDGRQEQQSYIEMSPRLTHPFDLHYVPERSAYCRFDEHGDVEDVIRVAEIPFDDPDENGRIVTIHQDILDEYMTMTGQSLVLLFDSTRFEPKNFGGWSSQNIEYHKELPEIWYRMGRSGSIASYLRGFQIIRSALTKKDLVKRHGFGQSSDRQYATFISHDWKHGVVRECSCDPRRLGNYFVKSDLPFEISPVFFRPEVLLKYKADSDKYQIQDRSVTCRNTWHLETYDVNDAGQVFTYLKYLSYLPYDEQLYWKSFNEPPKGPISKRAFQTDFEGNWDLQYDPLQSLKQILRELHEARVPWWKLRDETLMEKVHYPVTKSADEWAKEIHGLDKLLVEGFETRQLRSRATLLSRTVSQDWKSLKLLQEVLLGLGKNEAEMQEVVGPLQELNFLRTKVSGHASGAEAKQIKARILKEHKSYSAHFRQLCIRCDAAVHMLRAVL
jgi:hypothetical protein